MGCSITRWYQGPKNRVEWATLNPLNRVQSLKGASVFRGEGLLKAPLLGPPITLPRACDRCHMGLPQQGDQARGGAPIGYVRVREKVGANEVSRVVLDPERAMLVREAFRMYATGDYSVAELQSWLASKGLTSPYAKKPGAPPPVSAIYVMLTNPFYVGVVEWHGVQYEGQHKALISLPLFERVQEVLRAHDRVGVRGRRHDHYLKEMLFCGECGNRLSLTWAKGKYLYFFCLGQRGTLRKKTGCRQPYVLAADYEHLVEELYRKVQLPEEWVARLTQELEEEIVERSDSSRHAGRPRAQDRRARGRTTKAAARLLRQCAPAGVAQGGAGPHLVAGGIGPGGAIRGGSGSGQVAGGVNTRHPARRQLPRRLSQGAPEGPHSLQPGRTEGRVHQGPAIAAGRVHRGVRGSFLAPEFE